MNHTLRMPCVAGCLPDCSELVNSRCSVDVCVLCRMGQKCSSHHPLNAGTKKNNYGFPMRSSEVNCEFFLKHAICKFGMRCKKHHPHIMPGPPINKNQPFRVPKLLDPP